MKIEQLAKKIYLDNCKFNQVIYCVLGLRVGVFLNFNVPLAILLNLIIKSNDIQNQQYLYFQDLVKQPQI